MSTSLNANDMNCLLNTPVDSRSNRNVEMYRRQMRYYVNLYNNREDGDDDDDQNSVAKKVDNDHFDENDKENISAISGISILKETPIMKKPPRKPSSFPIPNQGFSERIAAAPIERTPLQPVQPLETIFEANMKIAETNKDPIIHRRKSTVSKNSKDVKFLINGIKYEVVQKLGFGGSSTVFECIDMNTRKAVAIKAIKVNHNSSFLDEANLLRKLQGNEYIIKIFDFEQHDDHLFVVLEKGECDLSRILKKSDVQKPLPVPSILFYWYQMLKAVQFIHANGIIHSDLKPSNFLLVEGVLKLIDFGIASVLPNDMTSVVKNELIGTFSYISPEAIMDSRNSVDEFSPSSKPKYKVNFKSDVWSLGCILYQMIYKKSPFQHIGNIQAKIMVIIDRNHEIVYKPIQKEYDYFVKISRKCLIYDYKERVSVDDLLRNLEKRLIW